jgi:hypothetical protein
MKISSRHAPSPNDLEPLPIVHLVIEKCNDRDFRPVAEYVCRCMQMTGIFDIAFENYLVKF